MTAPSLTSVAIAGIKVANRIRKDAGDIAGLAASMRCVGLINPITITPDGELLTGERRLRAAQSLGWTEIPVIVRSRP
jgi:ParB family chromosome partitioning protein